MSQSLVLMGEPTRIGHMCNIYNTRAKHSCNYIALLTIVCYLCGAWDRQESDEERALRAVR